MTNPLTRPELRQEIRLLIEACTDQWQDLDYEACLDGMAAIVERERKKSVEEAFDGIRRMTNTQGKECRLGDLHTIVIENMFPSES